MKHFKYSLLISCFLLFSYCNCNAQNANEAYVKATINGNTIVAKNGGFGYAQGQLIEMMGYFQFAISGTAIDEQKAKGVVVSIISKKSFKTLVVGTQWSANDKNLEDLPLGGYSEQSDTEELSADSETSEDAYLKITFIDKINRIVSGEFSFTASNGTNTYKITNGVFNKLSY